MPPDGFLYRKGCKDMPRLKIVQPGAFYGVISRLPLPPVLQNAGDDRRFPMGCLEVMDVQVFVKFRRCGDGRMTKQGCGQGNIPCVPEEFRCAQMAETMNLHSLAHAVGDAADLQAEAGRS